MPQNYKRRHGCRTYKDYSEDALNKALTELRNGDSLRTVAEKYGISKSTLHRKLNNKNIKTVGHPTSFSRETEELNKNLWLVLMIYTLIVVTTLYFVLDSSLTKGKLLSSEHYRDFSSVFESVDVLPVIVSDRQPAIKNYSIVSRSVATKHVAITNGSSTAENAATAKASSIAEAPVISKDAVIDKRTENQAGRTDHKNFEDPSHMVNCSLKENENLFWKHVRSVLDELIQDNSTGVLLENKGAYSVQNLAEHLVGGVCLSSTSISVEQYQQLLALFEDAGVVNTTTSPMGTANLRPDTKKYYHSILNEKKFDLRCSTCALVSSSGRMLGSKAGAEIDSHSCVVRMNDAPTIGFEEDVGSRTTIRLGSFVLVHKLNGSKYRFLFGKERAEYNLYWGLEGRSSSKLASYLRTVVKKNGSHSEVYYQNSKGEDLQNEVFRNMTGQSRMESRSWLSTGWFTFQLCLDVCDKLDVYGMVPENYCSRNRTEVKYHYYQGGRKPSECSTYKFVEVTRKHAHRFMTEKAVFAKWGALYNVSFHHPQWNLALEAGKNITTPFILRQNKKGNAVNAKRVIRRSVIRRPVVRRAVVSRKH